MSLSPLPPLIAVVGPTASGKTAAGVALAEKIGGEIVSADAVAVYRGLNIGAAKPTAEERARVPFHLIDVVDPDEEWTLSDFERSAQAAIDGIRQRGRTPILVGGSGLYIRAVTATLTVPAVPPQPALRAGLWAEAEAFGAPHLHARLAAIDAASAFKIHPGDAKRIIRALEVYAVTGQPLSTFHTPEGVQGIPRENTYIFGLRWEREDLYRRIDARVDIMLQEGLLSEVRTLLESGFGSELRSMQSLGYRHLCAHLCEAVPLPEAVEALKRDTRRFAKRQISWFKGDPAVRWIDMRAEPMAEAVTSEILTISFAPVSSGWKVSK